jgi:transcriptional regulator with XRE-family HTH domain
LASLGERIRARRKELGLTQTQLGGTDLTKGFISLVEKGRAKPSLETLLLLAERLQQPVAYFLEQGSALGAKALRVTLASGWTTLQQGDYTRAAAIFQDALPLAQAQGDERALAECHIGLGSALATLRQVDVAREHIDRGAALAEASGAAPLLVRVSYIRGLIRGGLCWCRSTGRSDPAPLVAPYQDSPRSAGSASRSHRLA